jgi:hypothetical protein
MANLNVRKAALACNTALAVAFAAPSLAHADVFDCGVPTVYNGAVGKNPAIATQVTFNHGAWSIIHVLAKGQKVRREDQYNLVDRSTADSAVWSGQLNRNPALVMSGNLYYHDGQMHYIEKMWDAGHNNKEVMHSDALCSVASIDQQTAPAAPAPVPAPVMSLPSAPSPGGSDVVPFALDNNAIHLSLALGGHPVDMLLDTGANVSSITTTLAVQLVSEGHAHYVDSGQAHLADGSMHEEKTVSIDSLTLGSHTRTNVLATITDDSGMMLLGLPVLNAIGRFTIDSANRQLVFG